MAKKSMIARNVKRIKTANRFSERRIEIKAQLKAAYKIGDFETVMQLQDKLQKMPRNASKTRIRNRCAITGRPRGYYRKFGLGRNKLREFTMSGDVPGVVKSSW